MQELQLAYIDPGTGSFLVQALVAAAAGLAVAARRYWGQIRALFGRAQPPAPPHARQARPEAATAKRDERDPDRPA